MHRIMGTVTLLVGLVTPLASSLAQDFFVYPAKGQSQAQQDKDRYECHTWAVQQTGYDPSNPPPSYNQTASQAPQAGSRSKAATAATTGATAAITE